MTIRVGLTGGIASGKSTVAGILRDLGAVVIDADALAREVVQRGTKGYDAVLAEFGPGIVGADGEIDRPKLGALVFADEDRRRRLEAIVHPLVFERIVELEEAAPDDAVVVHDIPLLAESGRAGTFDAVIVVDVPEALQVERAVARGMTVADAGSRMANQASREDRTAIATHLIDNSGTPEDLRQRVTEVYESLR